MLDSELSEEERTEGIRDLLDKASTKQPVDVRFIKHENGHEGKGAIIHPGSDGDYAVRVERDESGWIKRVIIEIQPEEDDNE